MQRVIEDGAPAAALPLTVGENAWRLYVYGVTRVGQDLFIHAALFGPWTCTAVVHVAAWRSRRDAARAVLSLVHDWLASGDRRDHVFLESDPGAAVAC